MTASPHESGALIRIRSDYVGAGHYLIAPDDRSAIVNTDYGIQAVGLDSHEHWQADFGERCLGVCRRPDGMIVANTLHAVYQIRDDGQVHHVNPTLNEIAFAPVPWKDGVLVVTLSHVFALDQGGAVQWKYAFKEALGASVRACLVLDMFPRPDGVVIGVVDYNSGLGRVLCLNHDGTLHSASDVGPITHFFLAGEDTYVYSLSGYGRFASHCVDFDGNERWTVDFGGAGTEMPDGRIAMLVGNNESPTWDDWELRILTAGGGELDRRPARGHYGYAPALGPDRMLYMTGYFKPFDPSATRLDYTSLLPLPRFLTFDHLMGVKAQPHQYIVTIFRTPVDGGELELLFEDRDSIAFGPIHVGQSHIFFTHNRDLLALPL